MILSNHVILEALRDYKIESNLEGNDHQKYTGVSILPDTPNSMNSEILYICRLSEAIAFNRLNPGMHYLAIRDRRPDNIESQECLNGIIIINELLNLGMLFNIVQTFFLRISDWLEKMKDCIMLGGSYQELMDLSEPVFGNFISVLDASYKLIAWTKNHVADDQINQELLQRGYHSEDSLKKFQKSGRFEMYRHNSGIILNPPGNPSKYSTVSKWLRYKGKPLIHIIMVCNKYEPSKGICELFELLVDHAEHLFEQNHHNYPGSSVIYSALISDMVYGDLRNQHIINERAKSIGQKLYGFFDLYRLTPLDESISINRFAAELSNSLPQAVIIQHDWNEVLVLNQYKNQDYRKELEKNMHVLRPLLNYYHVQCGVSECFTAFYDLYSAYQQATRAQLYGNALYELDNFWNLDEGIWQTLRNSEQTFFLYQNIIIYSMLHQEMRSLGGKKIRTKYVLAIESLLEWDKQNSSSELQILLIYLHCERRATSAGKLLHTHRNNVLYHIQRIEEYLHLDLSCPSTCRALEMAFRILEFEKMVLPETNLPVL